MGSDLRHRANAFVAAALLVKAATVNANVAIVKALLGFAHQVGYTRFNAAPLIKLRKAPRQLAQRILSEFDLLMGSHLPAGTAPCMECVIALIQIGVRRLPT